MQTVKLKYFVLALLFVSLILNVVQYGLTKQSEVNERNLHGTYAYDDEEFMLYVIGSRSHDTREFILSTYEGAGIDYLDKGVCKEVTPRVYKLSGKKKTYYLIRESDDSCTLIDYESDDSAEYRKVDDDVILGGLPEQLADELRKESEKHMIHSDS